MSKCAEHQKELHDCILEFRVKELEAELEHIRFVTGRSGCEIVDRLADAERTRGEHDALKAELARYEKEFEDRGHAFQKSVEELMRERDALKAKLERYKKWVNDLQSGMFINCVYCGHQYGPKESTPISMADVLKAHVEKCPEHPMYALKAKLAQAVEGLREMSQLSYFDKAEGPELRAQNENLHRISKRLLKQLGEGR